jgi:pimeloyl-ACP methyl ester carboxylesterase
MMLRPLRLVGPISLAFAAIQSAIAKPCLLYAGSADPSYAAAEAAAAKISNASFFTVPGLGHAEVMFRSELILPRAFEFLNSLEKQDMVPRT